MAKAIWKGALLAESNDYEEVEGNIYFPADSIRKEFLVIAILAAFAPGKVKPITMISRLVGK